MMREEKEYIWFSNEYAEQMREKAWQEFGKLFPLAIRFYCKYLTTYK
jgi:hypothetical protein